MTVLDPHDCVILSSITVLSYPDPSGDSCVTRTFVAYMRRVDAPAWQILLCEDLGDTLGPPLGSFPGPKEGSATIEAGMGYLDVRYSGRAVADALGPFRLQKERIVVPNLYPVGLVAALRARNIAAILVRHFPDLAEELGAYTK